MAKWRRGNNGNPETTVWLKKKTSKKGKVYWAGGLKLRSGKVLGIVVGSGDKPTTDRYGKAITIKACKLTQLPSYREMSDSVDMDF